MAGLDVDQAIPLTVEQAVNQLCGLLAHEDLEDILDGVSSTVSHFGGGMWIRNQWKLWEHDTPLKLDAVKNYGIAHADDISGLLFAWAWARVKGENFDPREHCKQYHEHWAKHGTSSLEAGGYDG